MAWLPEIRQNVTGVGSLEIIDAESVRQIVRLRECCRRHRAYHDTRGSSIARQSYAASSARFTKAVERLGGGREFLGVIGSWGDTLSDEEVLEALQRLNSGRCLFDEVFASTGGPALPNTPQARRSINKRRRQ